MTSEIVLPIWHALRDRFRAKVEAIPERDLPLQLQQTSIAGLLYHTAEAEYLFAEWFFGKEQPTGLAQPQDKEGYIKLLKASNEHLIQAINDLPEEQWKISKDSPMGATTPLEAIGRLMNHAGIHSGQMSLIQKTWGE